MYSTKSYRLSIEELAFAMGILGGADSASGLLKTTLGDRSQPELEGRLLAASHSLIARGLLEFDLRTQSKQLDENLATMVGVLLQSDFSIRCSRSVVDGELLCTYFFRGQNIVEHQIVLEVVSSIRLLASSQAAVTSSIEFFGLVNGGTERQTEPVGTISVSLLEQIREQPPDTAAKNQVTASLVGAGILPLVAENIAEDLLATEYRGSVIRIDNRDGRPVSDRGFLILKGTERYWLLEILEREGPHVRIFSGSTGQYRRLYMDLLTDR